MIEVRAYHLNPFGLKGDEPFIIAADGGTMGVREAFARGLLTPDDAREAYPEWDQVLSDDEIKWGTQPRPDVWP